MNQRATPRPTTTATPIRLHGGCEPDAWPANTSATLVARDSDGTVVGAALLDGPGIRPPFSAMLGDRAAGIGVTAARHGNGIGTALVARGSEILRGRGARVCHISWTTRASFYEALGYTRWRSYRMCRRP